MLFQGNHPTLGLTGVVLGVGVYQHDFDFFGFGFGWNATVRWIHASTAAAAIDVGEGWDYLKK